MKVHVALIRGINVGGRNVLPMKELVAIMESLGARDVRTYIQSGNVVFRSARTADRLTDDIAAAIAARRGFEPHVMILRLDQLEAAIRGNPFPESAIDPSSLHVGFLASAPAAPDVTRLNALSKPTESFRLIGSVFYLHAPDGIGKSKLAAGAEKALGVAMTDRNWKTVFRLLDLAQEVADHGKGD